MSGEWDGLRQAALGATPGPWEPDPDERGISHVASGYPERSLDWNDGEPTGLVCQRLWDADATYIAAASPDVVLGLLDRFEGLEAIVDRVKSAGFGWTVAAKHDLVSDVSARDLAATLGEVLLRIADDAAAPLSASGAESDHAGRGDGEGLG